MMRRCNNCKNKSSVAGQAFRSYKCPVCKEQRSHHNTAIPKMCEWCADKHRMCQMCGEYRFTIPCAFYIHKHGVKLVSNIKPYEFSPPEEMKQFLDAQWDAHLRQELDVNWEQLLWIVSEIEELDEYKQYKRDRVLRSL